MAFKVSLHLFLEVVRNLHHLGGPAVIKAKQSYKKDVPSLRHILTIYVLWIAHRNLVKSKVRSAQISNQKSLMRNLQSTPKAVYSYVKSKQKIRSVLVLQKRLMTQLTINDYDVAKTLNHFFESTFTQEYLSHIPVPTFKSDESVSSIDITKTTVFQRLYKLKVNRAP